MEERVALGEAAHHDVVPLDGEERRGARLPGDRVDRVEDALDEDYDHAALEARNVIRGDDAVVGHDPGEDQPPSSP